MRAFAPRSESQLTNRGRYKTFSPIRYSREQVALMLRIAAHDSIEHLATLTGTPAAELELMIAGERKPNAAVLAAFELQPNGGRGYTWQIS